jgi:hypothetical protein
MKYFEGKFDFQVDARHFGFKFTTADYIAVEYIALKKEGVKLGVTIMNVKAAPHVFGSISIHGSWLEMYREMEAAAKDHAEKELNGMDSNVHPTIMKAVPQEQAQTGELIESLNNINKHFRGAFASVINH